MEGMGKSPISWRNTFSSDSSQERVWWLEQANFSPAPSSGNLNLISDIPCAYQTPNTPTRHCLHRTILLPPTEDCGTACTASVGRTLPSSSGGARCHHLKPADARVRDEACSYEQCAWWEGSASCTHVPAPPASLLGRTSRTGWCSPAFTMSL